MEHDLFSMQALSSLAAIVLMDLVLAGDNALIIGLVARRLPKENQRKAIVCGTLGAIVVRAAMAVLVVYILGVPGFMLAGGLALVWIARKLVKPAPTTPENPAIKVSATTFAGALRTIIVADAVMGVDNALAIAGVADGHALLVVLGLAISVPIVVWGSQLVIWLVDRFPSVVLLGAAVLGWTAYSMILREPLLADWFSRHREAGFAVAVVILLLCISPRFGWGASKAARRVDTGRGNEPVPVVHPSRRAPTPR